MNRYGVIKAYADRQHKSMEQKMSKRRRLIVANWKMNGRLTSGLVLARDIAEKAEAHKPMGYDIVLCPPATLIWSVNEAILGTPVHVGGQDCHYATHGAFTGDISAAQLTDLGCRYVIVGHSERRQAYKESNELIAQKVEAAQLAGLTAILCVGETAEQLASGSTAAIITKMVKESLPANVRPAHLVVAYEPVWAIGSGQQPSPTEIAAVHKVIRAALGAIGETVQVLYGGSVSPANAKNILAEVEVDGVLVGSASLNSDGFWAIGEKSV
jgi:triosephosphate isomerase